MEIDAYLLLRDDLIENAKTEENSFSEDQFISVILPFLLNAKIVDSEDITNCYFEDDNLNVRIDGFVFNESGERLRLFVLDSQSLDLNADKEDLLHSRKDYYEKQIEKCTSFVKKSINRVLLEHVSDSSTASVLVNQLQNISVIESLDVIEIFLVSATIAVEKRGEEPYPKKMEFENHIIQVSYYPEHSREKVQKEVLVVRRMIDLSFLHNAQSNGVRDPLVVDLNIDFGTSIEAIKAADENNFETYLCVLSAEGLSRLYRRENTRLLERNVRSFLEFKGVNKGMKETIIKTPERFIAYNNGLTITASEAEVEIKEGRYFIKSLRDFQIVNGGQTTASIYFTSILPSKPDISKINIMAKINVAKNLNEDAMNDLITDISTYSNRQTRVSQVNISTKYPELIKLESLSKSVVTASGNKWFYERLKGSFNTELKIRGRNRGRLEKEFPKERRITNEELGKYYVAWGDTPHIVKYGGEKVFRYFLESITGKGEGQSKKEINRNFYEETIAKVILFRTLEKDHGQGKNSLGQLRSAVVPYSIALLHYFTTDKKGFSVFNFSKIWKEQDFCHEFRDYMKEVMILMNKLIMKYAQSNDFGQYSKKAELWSTIKTSVEVEELKKSEQTLKVLKIYERIELRQLKNYLEIDFNQIMSNAQIQDRGASFYERLSKNFTEECSNTESLLINKIHRKVLKKEWVDFQDIEDFEKILNRFVLESPEKFRDFDYNNDNKLTSALEKIIRIYNDCIEQNLNLMSEFEKYKTISEHKRNKYASGITEIAKKISRGHAPEIIDLVRAQDSLLNILELNHSEFSSEEEIKKKEIKSIVSEVNQKQNPVLITPEKLVEVLEWDNLHHKLSPKQKSLLTTYAYGISKIREKDSQFLNDILKSLKTNDFKN